ncbi:MAG: hypothetical protein H7Y22_03010 [Gemmatimonadaceae bacterium]|nr:hypothetical protein [Gloeobacterales cyanobacterium ES-bin-141]
MKGWMLGVLSALVPLGVWAQPAGVPGLGDINDDGRVDQADLVVLDAYLDGSGLLTDDQTRRADFNADSRVDSKDGNALRQRLGVASVPERPLDARASTDSGSKPLRASAEGATFQLGLESVVPEWVRGTWRFNSTVVEDRGFNSPGGNQREEISLPGDLSGLYNSYKVSTGERLERLCWQVNSYNEERFSFTERLRDGNATVFASTADITNEGPNQAQIRIRTEILDPGRAGGGSLLGSIFGAIFGGGGGGIRTGDYNIRTGAMQRSLGSEKVRLQDVNLDALRCR